MEGRIKGRVICDEHGLELYAYPCRVCGEWKATSWLPREKRKLACPECRELEELRKKAERAESMKAVNTALADRRLQIALEVLEKQDADLSKYEYAIQKVRQNLYRPNWFQSASEVLVALELIRSGIKARHQVRMGRWRVDFVLPELKVVLEVDNDFYHRPENKPAQKLRDSCIIAALGGEWEIIRINDDLIRQRLKHLAKAIHAILDGRKEARKKHNGKLPLGFSDAV